MGKKKDKQKQKVKQATKISRKDLEQELQRLRLLTDELQARLDRIAEIAKSTATAGEPDGVETERLTA